MSVSAILLPVFVQVALTFAVLVYLGRQRFVAVRGNALNGDPTIDDSAWPAAVRQAGNNFRNQFEMPVLFYVLVVLALATRKADLVFVILSWVFVLSRLFHTVVHVTSNDIKLRFPAYAVGVAVLAVMWVMFALAILLAPVLP
ncbi:MAG TPA: MAPEG family protein [Xanthobacteraceae bacterium]|nr:MAPEG family protein [Xanthobacteraceae bacterium]